VVRVGASESFVFARDSSVIACMSCVDLAKSQPYLSFFVGREKGRHVVDWTSAGGSFNLDLEVQD
jgi:hypothetical protein